MSSVTNAEKLVHEFKARLL